MIREDNKPLNKTTTWEYDAGGNILNRFEYAFTTANDLSDKTPTIIPYSYANGGIRDRLMEYNGEQFEYDTIGNPTLYRDNVLTWEKGRQLKSFGNIASYTYNASGIRTSKTAGSTTTQYYLDGTRVLAQKDTVNASGTPVQTIMQFIYGIDGIIGFTLNDTDYYYKKNLQGDVIGIYNNNLQLIAKYTYDAWGNHKISYLENGVFVDFDETNSYNESNTSLYVTLKNPFRYRGYYYDTETGLYYLNSRYYDPETGRFINIDEITVLDVTNIALNGVNLYAYCLNNPVNEVDEDGNIPNWLKWLLGTLMITVVAFLTVVTAGGFAAAGAAFAGALGIGSAVGGAAGFFAAATVGAIIVGGIGFFSGGISSAITGGNFWDGAADGFMWGTINGFLAGGFGTLFKSTGIIYDHSYKKAVGSIPQIILQNFISVGTYVAQSYANNNSPTFLGILATIFGATGGGLVAHTTLATQSIINILSEGIKTSIIAFKHVISRLFKFNSQENNWFW